MFFLTIKINSHSLAHTTPTHTHAYNHTHTTIYTQASITDLRQDLKTTITAIEELDSALQKILLAKKLGCAVTDLTHQTIECQSDKIGRVIGKQGATIKLLEEQCHVVMDVDSVAAKIKLTGSANAIAAAMTEIQNIILSVDVDVAMDKHVLGYLTSKVRAWG